MKSFYSNRLVPQYDVVREWLENDKISLKMVETSIIPIEVVEGFSTQLKNTADSADNPIPNPVLAQKARIEINLIDPLIK